MRWPEQIGSWATWVLILVAGTTPAAPQPIQDSYSIDVWQTEQGLPEGSVTDIAQTSDGYLWVGTFLGLARFDGTHFEIFDSRTRGLKSERVLRLHGDATGGLWISMESGDLACYANGRFTSFGPEQGWPMERCRVIASDSEKHVLFFTRTGGLFRHDHGRFVRMLPNVMASWPAGAMAADANPGGKIWAKRGDKLGWVNQAEWVQMQSSKSADSEKIGAITRSHHGGIWAFASNRLLRIKSPGSVESIPYPQFMDPNFLEEDSAGNLWVGTWGQGLIQLVTGEPPRVYSMANGFPNDSVRCFFEDREGNFWVGTNGGGLTRLRRKAFRSYGREQGLPPMHPLTLAEGAQGQMWIGFLDGGLFGLSTFKPESRLTQVRVPGRQLEPTVWSLLAGRDGRLWGGTFGEGIFLVESN